MINKHIVEGIFLRSVQITQGRYFLIFFTKEKGKQVFLYNSKFHKTSRLSFLPGSCMRIVFQKKKQTLFFQSGEVYLHHFGISYQKLSTLSYFLSVIDSFLLEGDVHMDIYCFLVDFFQMFKKVSNLDYMCIIFDIKILTLFGYIGDLSKYLFSNQKIILSDVLFFSLEYGAVSHAYIPGCITVSGSDIKMISFIQKTSIKNLSLCSFSQKDTCKVVCLFQDIIKTHSGGKISFPV